MRKHLLLIAVVAGSQGVGQAHAEGKGKSRQVRYVGIHPLAKAAGKGMCHIEAPHVHVHEPDSKIQYRDHRGRHYFVGDPVAYGWDGERSSYHGHHPVHVHAVVGDPEPHEEFCYLNGPHFHAFAPPPAVSADFKLDGGVYFYVGTPPEVYVQARPELIKVNAVYEPIVYDRPVVTVQPPAMWIGARFAVGAPAAGHVDMVAPAAMVHADVHIPAPSLRVEVGLPSVNIGIGGGVIVDGHHHTKVKHRDHRDKDHRDHRRGKGRKHGDD
jgi:hypothetical protein